MEALQDGIDFSLPLTRAKFEELNQDLFKKTLEVKIEDTTLEQRGNGDGESVLVRVWEGLFIVDRSKYSLVYKYRSLSGFVFSCA